MTIENRSVVPPPPRRRTTIDLILVVFVVASVCSLARLLGFRVEAALSLRSAAQVSAITFVALLAGGPIFAGLSSLRGHVPSTSGEYLWLAQSLVCSVYLVSTLNLRSGLPYFVQVELLIGIVAIALILLQARKRTWFPGWRSVVGLLMGLIPGILAFLYLFLGIGAPQSNP